MTKQLNDTIVACATPAGYSSIAVIRISGENAINLTHTIFIPHKQGKIEPHYAYYGDIVIPESNKLLDKVITTFYFAPNSYTGEDLVEISCHGNPLIIDRIIKLLLKLGARIAGRGEFTKRALLNGKIDLIQAEAVLDTIYSTCDLARELALNQYQGVLSKKIYAIRSQIIDLMVIIEANIDFGDEYCIADERDRINNQLKKIIEEIDDLLAGAEIGLKLKDGYRVLIMGRANVGKSTLFNLLTGFERALVHSEPGTTRDYLEENIEMDGLYLLLYDTAGTIHKPSEPDKIAVEKTIELIEQADLILLMFDGSEPMNEQDVILFNATKDKQKLMIVNKIDLNLRLTESEILSDSVKLSAKTGENVDLLKKKIKERLCPKINSSHLLLMRHRHIEALKNIKKYILAAIEVDSLEKLAFELNAALEVIGELTGNIVRKDILDRIFDEFCVGK